MTSNSTSPVETPSIVGRKALIITQDGRKLGILIGDATFPGNTGIDEQALFDVQTQVDEEIG